MKRYLQILAALCLLAGCAAPQAEAEIDVSDLSIGTAASVTGKSWTVLDAVAYDTGPHYICGTGQIEVCGGCSLQIDASAYECHRKSPEWWECSPVTPTPRTEVR